MIGMLVIGYVEPDGDEWLASHQGELLGAFRCESDARNAIIARHAERLMRRA